MQKDGTQRASRLFERKTEAVARATQQARREHTELVVKDLRGRIQEKSSYGNDPRRTRG